MDFLTIKKKAAMMLQILDQSDLSIITDADVTETGLGVSINDAYLEEIVPSLKTQYPDYFRRYAYLPNYTDSATVGSDSTGTTVVVDTPIFDIKHINQKLYNDDLETSATITAITSAYVATLDTEIDDDWDGDTVKILEDWISIQGDALNDFESVRQVGVRFDSTTEEYITADYENTNDYEFTGLEVAYQDNPKYFVGSTHIADEPYDAIRIRPGFSVPDDRAIKLAYIEIPPQMSRDEDVPRLPKGHHEFLKWKAVYDGAMSRGDFNLADRAITQYEKGKMKLLSSYRPTSTNKPIKIKTPRMASYLFDKDY